MSRSRGDDGGSRARQRDVFLESEGDAYEERNAETEANRALLGHLVPHLRPEASVLEIGCGSGRNLVCLERLVPGILCSGIDPSPKAIERGRLRSPHHRLAVGTADAIPFKRQFDLVIFGFCLYLCDRSLLHTAVAQADLALRGGEDGHPGVLAILDFDTDRPHRRRYRHDTRLATFKMDYSGLFLADPAYRLVAKYAFDHARGEMGWAEESDDRVALWVLEKNLAAAYPQHR